MMRLPSSQPPPSRWDALRCDDDNMTVRPQYHAACKPPSSNSNRSKSKTNLLRRGDIKPTSDNWRRRVLNENDNNDSATTETEIDVEKKKSIKKVMQKLQTATSSCSGDDVQNYIKQLLTVIFGSSSFIDEEHSCCYYLHNIASATAKPVAIISKIILWETTYSLIHLIQQYQLLSSSSQSRHFKNDKYIQFIHKLSLVILPCLQSFIPTLQNNNDDDQPTQTKAMTDIRLCECATIILNLLEYIGDSDNVTTSITEENIISFKATLFSCLASILVISRRGPLFPWGAEKTVNLLLPQSVLPFLESLSQGDINDTTIPMKVKYSNGAMECLFFLLQDPSYDDNNNRRPASLSRHGAAIMAPLVIDVLPDGKEKQTINPLRSRTLNAICRFWEWSALPSIVATNTDLVLVSCQYMAAALNALSAIRKGKAQNNLKGVYDTIDVSTISRQLQSMIQNEKLEVLRPKLFNLLALLCLAYPTASASQWHLFLERTTVKQSPLLSTLDQSACALEESENIEDESMCWTVLPSALRATSTLLDTMPLALWIGGDARRGNLSTRVRNALLCVLESVLKMIKVIGTRLSQGWSSNNRSMEAIIIEVSEIARKLCTDLTPFNGENSILLQPTSMIVQCVGEIYVQSVKALSNNRLMTRAGLEQSLHYKAMSHFSRVITESLGSTVSKLPTPCVKWLEDADDASIDFIGLLLTDSYWIRPLKNDRMEMLSTVAKVSPIALAREPFNFTSFCELCVVQSSSSLVDSRILGLKLIESFIIGRKNCLDRDTIPALSVFPECICQHLIAALDDKSSAIRSCSVSAIGSLLKSDWMELFRLNVDNANELEIEWSPFDSILRLCDAKEEKVSNVRLSSCKAIGEICAECICQDGKPLPDHFILSFTSKICEAMVQSLADEVPSVRYKALFAIGNAAFAMKDHDNYQECAPSFQYIFPSICACLNDKDEKVVANAIRSISHTSYFMYRPECLSKSEMEIDTCSMLLSKLSAKVNFAIDDAIGESPSGLTWKQRNGAKKQAWNACTTLGTLLGFSDLLPFLDDLLLESTLSCLFRCIVLSNIHKKIATAAVTALTELPIGLWQRVSGKCDTIGRGLAVCFSFLNEIHQGKTKPSYHLDVECLAKLLLQQSKKVDFCNMFLFQESIPFSFEHFYQWLVTHRVNANVFEAVAAALSSKDIAEILDVSVVQMFLSRTIQVNEDASLSADEIDEEDEL